MTQPLRFFTLVLLAALIAGCVGEESEAPEPEPLPESAVEVGAYAGVLPCGYCSGIRTELRLYTEEGSDRPLRYTLKQTYLDIPDGDQPVERTGRWTILRGSARDPDATVFQIAFNDPQLQQSFLKVSEDELRLLDRLQGEIPSADPPSLHRIPLTPAGG